MNYKLINLFNLEEINVKESDEYFIYIGKKNEYVKEPTDLLIKKDDKDLTYVYFLEDEFYIPKCLIKNSCIVFNKYYTYLVKKINFRDKYEIRRVEKEYAFDLYYQRKIEINNGLDYNINEYDVLVKKFNNFETILLNYCFDILNETKNNYNNILFKSLLFLIDYKSIFRNASPELIRIIEKPYRQLLKDIYNTNWNLISVINSILNKMSLDMVYYSENILNINATFQLFSEKIIEMYNYNKELNYPKKYKKI